MKVPFRLPRQVHQRWNKLGKVIRFRGWDVVFPPIFVILLFVGCGQKPTLDEKRQKYNVKLTSWIYQDGKLYLDMLVNHEDPHPLPFVTAELYHFDKKGKIKKKYFVKVPVKDLSYGMSHSVTLTLEIPEPPGEEEGFGLKYYHYPDKEQKSHYEEYRLSQSPS